MNEMIKEVEAIYQLLSTVPVSGDAIDTMAIVRNKLRNVYAGLKKAQDAEGGDA